MCAVGLESVASYNRDLRPSLSLLWESVELEKYRGSGPEETIWCPMCYLAVFSARLAALLCFIFSVRYAYIQDGRKILVNVKAKLPVSDVLGQCI